MRQSTLPCQVCDKQHNIWSCNDFIQKSVPERWNIARVFQLCYRCLGATHYGKTCKRSRQCGINACRQLHHKLLHQEDRNSGATEAKTLSSSETVPKVVDMTEPNHGPNGSSSLPLESLTSRTEGKGREDVTTLMVHEDYQPDFIALRTVPVMVKSGGKSIKVNALLDDASTKTYINSDVAAELGLQGKTERVTVNVLNGQIKTFNTRPIEVQLESLCGNVRTNVTAFTADQVTGDMEAVNWNKYKRNWPHLKNIVFPYTNMRPRVDVLIGLDCADLHHAVEEVRGRPGEPIARLTPLGWTCIGTPGSNDQPKLQTRFSSTFFVRDQTELEKLNTNLKKFWEIEDTPSSKEQPIIRVEEKSALKKLEMSLRYDDKMYRVGIPWREDTTKLPDNYKMALQRLENTEKKLQRSPNLATAYKQVIESYIQKGYVRKIPEHEQSSTKWFLPHFPVLRPDKETTKTRIVFDASAKCHGVSLNDAIYQGPKLQQDLFDVLLRFRRFPVALVCDIAEMYLRIGISPEDQIYHRFLWRGCEHFRKPDVFEFDRVVFGVNSSPFQAQYVLRQHAKKFQGDYPIAAETILHSTYMDDSMDSIRNEERAIELYTQLARLLSAAGMFARKWLSNSSRVLEQVPLQDRKSEVDLDTDPLPCAKTLGVWWQASEDTFTFKENAPEDTMLYTKRNFLKKIATLFDPIGFLAPFTIRANILLQDMWSAGLEWDDELNETLATSARAWFKELSDLQQLHIPRCLQDKSKMLVRMSLQTFVDASESAYGSVVYSRCTYEDGSISSTIIASKTRVAPTTATSIPRLELMGAVIGVRLTSRIAKVLDVNMNDCVFWSDSVNVLWWVRGRSREFKPFIANRVGEIQTSTRPEQWRYIPTAQNPADCVTRGMSAANLVKSNTWWRGPEFLRQDEENWPAKKSFEKPTGDAELKRCATATSDMRTSPIHDGAYLTVTSGGDSLTFPLDPSHFSSWLRLRRVLSWINRFINNCQKFRKDREYGELLSSELKNAEIQLIRYAQYTEFPEEWAALSHGRQLSSNSKIIGLRPKIDDDGLMRSDGRLQNAKFLSYDVRYPVILPRNSKITKLIVKEFHETGNHASGTNQTLAALSARYWIISAREVIRQWEKECMECRRRKGKPCEQIMAPLPLSRLKTSLRAFSRIAKVLDVNMNDCVFWSDSVNVLWWVRGRSREFKPFIAIRVGEIQTSTRPEQWRYIPTAQNPADCVTRGMSAANLVKSNTWWRGPEFLRQDEENWPAKKSFEKPTGDAELKRCATATSDMQTSPIHDGAYFTVTSGGDSLTFSLDPSRFSSWLRLRRVLSWINRFINNCQKFRKDREYGELLSSELKNAEIQLIRYAQYTEFPDEWAALSHGRQLSSNSKIIGLRPKIDDDGLMRSDGRLQNAKFLSYDVRYPVILPRNSKITKLIVKEFHETGNHASGTNQTLAALSARYWIISAREVIRQWEKECMECRRRKGKPCEQIMAPLPLSRLKTSLRAFSRTAVDFGGPYITVQGRGKSRQKRYLCLFTCLATRAVHLEVAFGLDTSSFLNAFYRMVNRRGLPAEIYSDNATNFKAADKELKALLLQLDEDKIKESTSNKGIVWHFTPPLAPHFGGVHESMIKSAKKALNAILGNADITDEELMTALTGAEALVNSRPLTYQSANPHDDIPLTPNHFLHGQIGGHFAPSSVDSTQFNLRKRWRRIQELVRHFWHRWLREWIPTLSARKKWHRELGRILEVYPGTDGRVRVAKVQVGDGTLVRSVNKLCPLEYDI